MRSFVSFAPSCSMPGLCHSPLASFNFLTGDDSSSRRISRRISTGIYTPSSSILRRKSHLNTVTQHRLRTELKTLEARNNSGKAFSLMWRFRQGRSRRFRAENQSINGGSAGDEAEEQAAISDVDEKTKDGSVGDKSSEGALSRMRNAYSTAFMQFYRDFTLELENETGFNSEVAKDRLVGKYRAAREKSGELLIMAKEDVQIKMREVRDQVAGAAQAVRNKYWPQFVNWNRIELWQNRTQWDVQRVGALILYVLLFGAFLRGAHLIVTTPRVGRKSVTELTDAYLESVIPEPTPANIRKFQKTMWREKMPEGFGLRKYKLGEDGVYQQDFEFPGDNPEEAANDPNFNGNKMIDESDLFTAEEKEQLKRDIIESKSTANLERIDGEVRVRVNINDIINEIDTMTPEEKEKTKMEIVEEKAHQASYRSQAASGQEEGTSKSGVIPTGDWQERLRQWEKILEKERLKESLDSATSRYGVDLSQLEHVAEVERAKQNEARSSKSMRAFWVARKWWKHRPKLPYTYLLAKIENQEVRAAVYTEDMRKLYVTMKEGFPTDYVADLPVDPSLYELLETNGVEIDVLHRSDMFYYGRILLVLLPNLLIIWYIRELLYQGRERASEKIYDLLSMNRQHLILPEDAADKARSQYKDVVVGGDIWQVIDEIMIYMRNPMKYHDRNVKLPRGILISGPPGTGKTLLARAIARESGLPFVFASGAEFVESGTGTGTDKVFDVFFTARANAPSFIFIDEIDALAGKNAKDDAERRATFEQLLSELDGEPEDTDVDRFSPRQAVILICATNRPDELDEEFMRPGRIDREIHIGLPGEEERVDIFDVHSQGKRVAKDVDFSKLVFRTIGYSGADIRNLINEAGIMAVRKDHDEISQQDLVEVLDKQLFEGMGVVLMDDEQKRAEQKIPGKNKRLLAVHEAGHVLLAHLFPRFDWHAFSHLLPGGSEAAISVFYPRQEMLQLGHTTIGYVMMQMVVAHGGRCAERLVYGDNISDGGQDDLARISAMARELTISPTNRRLGLLPMKWRDTLDPPKLPGEVELVPNEWEKTGTQIVNMSIELSELFTREVTKYVEETEDLAMASLTQNRHILEKLADVLLSKTKLSGFEAEDIIRSMNPVLLPDFMHSGPKIDFKAFEEKVTPPKMAGRYEELNIYPAPLHQS